MENYKINVFNVDYEDLERINQLLETLDDDSCFLNDISEIKYKNSIININHNKEKIVIKKISDKKYKITIKDFFESDERLVINCETLEQTKIFCETAYKLGKTWNNGESYLNSHCWEHYEEETCYENDGAYADLEYYKDAGYKIYKFDEIDFNIENKE